MRDLGGAEGAALVPPSGYVELAGGVRLPHVEKGRYQ